MIVDSVVYDRANLRFVASKKGESRPDDVHVVGVQRISDGRLIGQFFVECRPTLEQLQQLSEQWILAKAGNDEPHPTFCAECGTTLQSRTDTDYQYDEALWIRFGGGYGMFIDQLSQHDVDDSKVLLCVDCAKHMADVFPSIKKVLFRYLNINIGHECSDGSLQWVPQPECTIDPAQHGWATANTPRANTTDGTP